MTKWKSVLEACTNVAILCVCLLIGVIGVKKFLLNSSPTPDITLKQGMQFSVENVNWSRADRTLVMALSTQCHFCSESSGFYQQLLPAAVASKVPVVAVFPQTTSEAQDYWTGHNLPLDGVKLTQESLDRIQVMGTPTLIVVDRTGHILRAWAGKLPAQGEAEVIKAIHG